MGPQQVAVMHLGKTQLAHVTKQTVLEVLGLLPMAISRLGCNQFTKTLST